MSVLIFLQKQQKGMYIYDENGTPYLDFYAGIAVNNAGNRNPKVVAAVKDQVDDIMHTLIIHTQFHRHYWLRRSVIRLEWIRSFIRTLEQKPMSA